MSWTRAELVALMADAVEFSIRHVESGGLPFVGVVIDENGYVSRHGVNEVHRTEDPTAHAEIMAMRSAMRDRDLNDLRGTTLLATGEPCGLCYRYAIDHRVERIYVAVDSDTVAEHGFDYRGSYPAFHIDRPQLTSIVHRLPVARQLEPFERFLHLNRNRAHPPTLPPKD
ncbi:tRNA-specific adenosine deaminase [Micromonospora sonchi]|uniref:tRNA-specific adenosine deaminase n=1 Tax=Micromonospora sonchi TaxID=1763543 RepID=A0A917WTL0_9ACTN|nr:deaminase [Micromonospora sonchi]GGM28114.1 tRNA-specific adenosine deaminase [Micromonospora sonchi]